MDFRRNVPDPVHWNREKWKNDVYAVKCAKSGKDAYRSRVKSRFRALSRRIENLVFFDPEDRGAKKTRSSVVAALEQPKQAISIVQVAVKQFKIVCIAK